MNEPKRREAKESTKEREENKNLLLLPRAAADRKFAYSGAWQRGITKCDINEAADKIGMPPEEVEEWVKYMTQVGWQFSTGKPINGRNFRRSLRMWHRMEPIVRASYERIAKRRSSRSAEKAVIEEQMREKQAKQAEASRAEAAKKRENWELCEERCALYHPVYGCCGQIPCPPALAARPHPPEECPKFVRKEGQ